MNPYMNNQIYMQDLQNMRDRIDAQMKQMQQLQQAQHQQSTPTNLTQTFQLAPQTSSNSELQCQYASNIEEVKNTFVMKNAIFITKDLSTMWQKDVSGNIRIFKTKEIIPRDEKDIEIQELKEKLSSMENLLASAIQPTSPNTENSYINLLKGTRNSAFFIFSKKFLKSFQKVLTLNNTCDIILNIKKKEMIKWKIKQKKRI